jgi:hypothetical protein
MNIDEALNEAVYERFREGSEILRQILSHPIKKDPSYCPIAVSLPFHAWGDVA